MEEEKEMLEKNLAEPRGAIGLRDVQGQTDLRALRIKVAELCGWIVCSTGDGCWIHTVTKHHHTLQGGGGTEPLPDYPNDLNACAQFEKALKGQQRHRYYDVLLEQRTESVPFDVAFGIMSSTAEERCRAFVAALEAPSVPAPSEEQPVPPGN